MIYAGYCFIERTKMTSVINRNDLNLERVYQHFEEKMDECIYAVDGENLVGVVSVSDWQKAYAERRHDCINSQFSYIEDIDYKSAGELIRKIKKIHEIPVIQKGKFIGVIANGEHKSANEWDQIRKDNKRIKADIKYRRKEWYEAQIREFFNYVRPSIYVYYFDEKKLKWAEEDWENYKKKLKYKSGAEGFLEMSDKEQRDFWGEYYCEDYIKEFIENYRELRQSCRNGITKVDDICSRHFNVLNGRRKVPGSIAAERKIFFIGPCTVFGAYVSENQTIEYYLHMLLKENNIYGYEIVNLGTLGGTAAMAGRLSSESVADNDIVIYWAIDDRNALEDVKDNYSNIKMGSDWTEAYNGIANPTGNIFNGISHCNYKINKALAQIIFNDIKHEVECKSGNGGGGGGVNRFEITIFRGKLCSIIGNIRTNIIYKARRTPA